MRWLHQIQTNHFPHPLCWPTLKNGRQNMLAKPHIIIITIRLHTQCRWQDDEKMCFHIQVRSVLYSNNRTKWLQNDVPLLGAIYIVGYNSRFVVNLLEPYKKQGKHINNVAEAQPFSPSSVVRRPILCLLHRGMSKLWSREYTIIKWQKKVAWQLTKLKTSHIKSIHSKEIMECTQW